MSRPLGSRNIHDAVAFAKHFWSQVERTETCWLWRSRHYTNGYGRTYVAGRDTLAHRVAWTLTNGEIPVGLDLDHLCRVRDCVRPTHLEPVTRRENLIRGVGLVAIRVRQTACIHGHAFDEANTGLTRDGRRVCRECRRQWQRAKRAAA